jgi:hypothetical protein
MEDVQYLKNHAEIDSFLFVVDSRRRDIRFFPTPSKYDVHFQAPFRNVCGFDLVDCMIPRTERAIEINHNIFWYAFDGESMQSVTVPPGDYTLPLLAQTMNALLQNTDLFVEAVSQPSELTDKLKIYANRPFSLFMGEETSMRHVLGFGDPIRAGYEMYYDASSTLAKMGVSTEYELRTFKSVSTATNVDAWAYLGPFPVLDYEILTSTRRVKQRFVAAYGGTVSSLRVHCTIHTNPASFLHVSIVSSTDQTDVFAVTTLSPALDREDPVDVAATQVTSIKPLVATHSYDIIFSMDTPDALVFLYRASHNVAIAEKLRTGEISFSDNDGVTWTEIPQFTDDICASLGVRANAYQIISPGVVDLTGERYVLIRCDEIEQQLFRDRSTERVGTGLGLVKLGGFGYRENRFDFVRFSPREFHPIGKLTKLTFRLEKSDGTPYECHGVDHTLTIVLKYYTAVTHTKNSTTPQQQQQMQHHQSSGGGMTHTPLNPSYDPDARTARITKWGPRNDTEDLRRQATRFYSFRS